jgi:hypothetical protein
MTTSPKQKETRYTPATPAAQEVLGLMDAYCAAQEVAHAVHVALANWGKAFIGVQPGDIVESGKHFKSSACFIPALSLRGSFTGWKGNKPRMLVESVTAVTNTSLHNMPKIEVLLKGVALKDDGQPFKNVTCSVIVDVVEQATIFDFDAEGGYYGYLNDAMSRYVDNAVALQATKTVPTTPP